MEPQNHRFGGGATETLLNPLVAVWLLVAIVLILTLPRRKTITPFLLAFCTIPMGQVVLLGGLHFTAFRILILAGLLRAAIFKASSSGRWFPGRFNGVDQMVVLWTVSAFIVISIQWMNSQMLVTSLGDLLDALGGYLVVRFLIDDGKAVQRTFKTLVVICALQAVCMIGEQITHVNVYGWLGGIPLMTEIRDGKFRSGGVLGPLISGISAGVLLPIFVWLWREGNSRVMACLGLASAAVMLVTSNSSTPWMALGGSVVGLGFWFLRKQMRLVRWGFVLALVALHLAMKAPVWALIARVDLTGSSSSYHRYYLLDNCIRHFSDWWLIGYRHYNEWGWAMWDLCNQFVAVALTGGLLTLIFFVAIYIRTFKAIGRARKQAEGCRKQEFFFWCLGSTTFANVVASFGMNYVAQLLMLWFTLLAIVSVATYEAKRAQPASADVKLPEQVISSSEELSLLNA